MEGPRVYPDRAVVTRREPALISVRLPYTGDLSGGLRRRASAVLRSRIVDGKRIRGAAIMVESDHLTAVMAGNPETLDAWQATGRLARETGLAVSEAYDQQRRRRERAQNVGSVHARWR